MSDVYFKGGLLDTIGLAATNAVLIIKLPTTLEKQGKKLVATTLVTRLRGRKTSS